MVPAGTDRVGRIVRHRQRNDSYRLLFHDTHHRSLSHPASLQAHGLEYFDGILVYGESIRRIYLDNGWNERVWTWHEAADVRVFHPLKGIERIGDLVWIGNWGDEERTAEYSEYLLKPVQSLRMSLKTSKGLFLKPET